jgi:hypothetical protein
MNFVGCELVSELVRQAKSGSKKVITIVMTFLLSCLLMIC